VDNPFQEGSRSYRLFAVLARSDRPLRPRELAGAVGEDDATVAHSMLKDLRARGVRVYRYRDPHAGPHAESLYALHPVDGLVEATSSPGRPRRVTGAGPPPALRPPIRQPAVGSPVRITGVYLDGDDLATRFDCDGIAYRGTAARTAPTVGEWMTLVTVGLHGHGLYVDLAGTRQITIENITEDADGVG
jgi:hypothetical protein